MEWWDDFWLNEGFASFMEFPSMDYIHPDWKIVSREHVLVHLIRMRHELRSLLFTQDDQVVVLDMSLAFAEDSLANSHPIRIPITRPEDIRQIFDSITYEKVLQIILYAIDFAIIF